MKKCCTNCKQEKLLIDFYKRSIAADGRCSECKSCSKQRNKKIFETYYKNNKDEILIKNKRYLETYKEGYKPRRNIFLKEKRKTDINFKLAHNLRRRMRSAIKRNQKTGSAVSDLGCSIEFFKQYIEAKFKLNMSWDNYGKWHLDHIKPLSSFNLSDRNEFLKAAHYTNYQPLWAIDNLKKSNQSSGST